LAAAVILSLRSGPQPKVPEPSTPDPTASAESRAAPRVAHPPNPTAPDASTTLATSQPTTEERVAALTETVSLAMSPERDGLTERLVTEGLSRTDAERAGQRFVEGYAGCLLEAVRRQYEAQGMHSGEFLDRTETAWLQLLEYARLNRVRAAMSPCLANVAQQVGIPFPASFGATGTLDEQIVPPPPPPAWAAEADERIRGYVASRPGLGVAAVRIECVEQGCTVMLVGRDIRIFELEFDVFAERNGFARAVLRGDGNRRLVWLER
jgi:hypothetical protein